MSSTNSLLFQAVATLKARLSDTRAALTDPDASEDAVPPLWEERSSLADKLKGSLRTVNGLERFRIVLGEKE